MLVMLLKKVLFYYTITPSCDAAAAATHKTRTVLFDSIIYLFSIQIFFLFSTSKQVSNWLVFV